MDFGSLGLGVDLEEEEEEEEENEWDIDDSLPPIEKLRKYIESPLIMHRLYLVKELGETARAVGYDDTIKELLPLLHRLSEDAEQVIRQASIEQIPDLVAVLLKDPTKADDTCLQVLQTHLLPLVAKRARDPNPTTRTAAVNALAQLAELTHHWQSMKDQIFTIVTTLAADEVEEEHVVEAAQLVFKCAHAFGHQMMIERCIPLIQTLSANPVFRVRKAIAAHLGSIAKQVGNEVAPSTLLPIFVTLAKDEIWGVRKACAESLVEMSEAVLPTHRENTLCSLFAGLADDPSRWVRTAAYQNLGRFIATFDHDAVSPRLLGYFTGMANPKRNAKLADGDLLMFCAFNFPGVLQTIGAERWPEVAEVYALLVKDLQWKVRRSLAHSLHAVAAILGPVLSERCLLPAFNLFYRDVEEVKVGVIPSMAEFFGALPMERRRALLPLAIEVAEEPDIWRYRKLLARQIAKFSQIYEVDDVVEVLVPIALRLCRDPVASVRKAAVGQIGSLIQHLDHGREQCIEGVCALALSSSCHDRKIFASMCESLVDQVDAELLEKHFLSHILNLASDRVPNVRFSMARVLAQKLAHQEKLEKHQLEIKAALKTLQLDNDSDVAFWAHFPTPPHVLYGGNSTGAFVSSQSNPSAVLSAVVSSSVSQQLPAAAAQQSTSAPSSTDERPQSAPPSTSCSSDPITELPASQKPSTSQSEPVAAVSTSQ